MGNCNYNIKSIIFKKQNTLNRSFEFQTFEQAVRFVSLSNNYLNQNGIKSTLYFNFKIRGNVYNRVEVKIEETYLKQLTLSQVKAAEYLDSLSESEDPISDIVATDYYRGETPITGIKESGVAHLVKQSIFLFIFLPFRIL